MIKALPNAHVYERETGTLNPHIPLEQAFQFAASVGCKATRVLFTFRDPYAVEVSMYHYARQYPVRAGIEAEHVKLANSGDFSNYLRHNTAWPSFEYYMQLGSRIYEDIVILKVEEDFRDNLKRLVVSSGGDPTVELPFVNATVHDEYHTYYTPETEGIVYNKYKWVFDRGYYKRSLA